MGLAGILALAGPTLTQLCAFAVAVPVRHELLQALRRALTPIQAVHEAAAEGRRAQTKRNALGVGLDGLRAGG